jgi:hypothetical protein
MVFDIEDGCERIVDGRTAVTKLDEDAVGSSSCKWDDDVDKIEKELVDELESSIVILF